MPRIVASEYRRRAAIEDVITIPFAHGVICRMKAVRSVFERADRDVIWQQRVEAALQVLVGEVSLCGQAHYLAQCVDAGVGATSCRHAERFLGEFLPSRFNGALHRWLIGLNLPAGVRAAVIRYGQLEPASGHEDSLSRNGRLRANQ